MESQDRRHALLRKVPLFASFAPERLEALVGATSSKRLAAREELFHKGDPAAQVYVVASGRLKVVTTSADGDEVLFAILDEGEVVGELPMLTGGRRTASVVALEPSELLALARRDFLRFLREQPECAIELMVVLAERYGAEDADGTRIDLRLSQGELADLVGTTRESVNKQIRAWSEQGVVRMARGEVTILDRERLERFAGLSSH